MLMCDLRTLFTKEEWKGLDTCVGDNWKAVQVQCESQLTLNCWGFYVFKQKTHTDDIDISFKPPSLNSSGGDYVQLPIPASSLVPKSSPQMSGQIMRHRLENLNPREIFGEYLPLLELEEYPSFTMALLRSWRIAKADIKGEASAIAFGGSLTQEHEESNWDVVRCVELIKDNIPKHIVDMCGDNNDIQNAQQIVEEVLRARVEFMREKGSDRLDIDMPVILEAWHFGEAKSRRYWGKLQIEHDDQKCKAVLNKTSQLAWKHHISTKEVASMDMMNIVLLKCQRPSTEESSTSSSSYEEEYFEEEYYDPVLEELMSMIEEDAMRFNKSFGKLKASIVLTDEIVSDKYLVESLFLRGQENLAQGGNTGLGYFEMGLVGLTMLYSVFSDTEEEIGLVLLERMGSNFKKIHYGKLRVEDEPFDILKRKCFWDSSSEDLQIAFGVAERILRTRVELMKENSMYIGMPIILEYTDTSGATYKHFWGTVEIKLGDPFYKPLLKRKNQIFRGLGMSDSYLRVIIVELKCQPASEEEASSSRLRESLEEGNYNPELEELMKMIEQDAMKFNKSCGKMRASIVQADESFSDNYRSEALLYRRLMILGKLTMFGSATKFKITPYGYYYQQRFSYQQRIHDINASGPNDQSLPASRGNLDHTSETVISLPEDQQISQKTNTLQSTYLLNQIASNAQKTAKKVTSFESLVTMSSESNVTHATSTHSLQEDVNLASPAVLGQDAENTSLKSPEDKHSASMVQAHEVEQSESDASTPSADHDPSTKVDTTFPS
ncbi:hypothetical protein TSUD_265610 [Trifolium subterraneum]|uniref:Uncharacterized protein n=1 Tax=Trifolium subterraneum TaxID=3900 RepID=A0A2Z6PLP9_TRISU|nr:hypothetical protein TSUD_265610 [Trifolium subterraneum]